MSKMTPLEVLTFCSVQIYCSAIWSRQNVILRRALASRTLKCKHSSYQTSCMILCWDESEGHSKTSCQEWLIDLWCTLPTTMLHMKIYRVAHAFWHNHPQWKSLYVNTVFDILQVMMNILYQAWNTPTFISRLFQHWWQDNLLYASRVISSYLTGHGKCI